MRITITTQKGSQSDGIVLATCGSMIRVAIPGCDDAAEFSCKDGQWLSEAGESVEIDALAVEDSTVAQNDDCDLDLTLNDWMANLLMNSSSCKPPSLAYMN
jgi:hypothetical protein